MHDPFEESLRDMLRSRESAHDDDAVLDRVLKTANRRVGMGDLFELMGNCFSALMIALNNASPHLRPVSRLSRNPADKVDQ